MPRPASLLMLRTDECRGARGDARHRRGALSGRAAAAASGRRAKARGMSSAWSRRGSTATRTRCGSRSSPPARPAHTGERELLLPPHRGRQAGARRMRPVLAILLALAACSGGQGGNARGAAGPRNARRSSAASSAIPTIATSPASTPATPTGSASCPGRVRLPDRRLCRLWRPHHLQRRGHRRRAAARRSRSCWARQGLQFRRAL